VFRWTSPQFACCCCYFCNCEDSGGFWLRLEGIPVAPAVKVTVFSQLSRPCRLQGEIPAETKIDSADELDKLEGLELTLQSPLLICARFVPGLLLKLLLDVFLMRAGKMREPVGLAELFGALMVVMDSSPGFTETLKCHCILMIFSQA